MIREALRSFKHRRREARALAEIAARPDAPGKRHGLPSDLIVSLTSYPARFGTLAPTLRSILRQSMEPDRVILWLADGDEEHLPSEIHGLSGLEVRTCRDWRSYKKIIPALLQYPAAYIVTADDDVYYPFDWLEQLTCAVSQGGAAIACHRAHRVKLTAAGQPAAYEEWEHNLPAAERGPLVFPTGVSGVLYSPDVFHPDVTRSDLFMDLAPSADDVWLYWMHRMAGTESSKVGGKVRILEWTGSQSVCLRTENRRENGNDRAVRALLHRYGAPVSLRDLDRSRVPEADSR